MKIDEQTSPNLCIILFYSCFREKLILDKGQNESEYSEIYYKTSIIVCRRIRMCND